MLTLPQLQKFQAGYSDDFKTPEEEAMERRRAILERLMGRNTAARDARVPGAPGPELNADEQRRVSDRLMRSARGGMVDETSPLNNRAGLYAAAAERDKSKELQKQAEQEAMSKRFRSLQATREPDAQVESSTSATRPGSNNRGTITTIAEKIVGVEDDPSTPMDESVRYRAEWDGIDPKVLRERRSSQVKENREKRQEQFVGSRMSRRLQQAAGPSDMEMFQQAMRQAMAFDAANQGRTQLASTLMSKFGDYRVQDLAGKQQAELVKPGGTVSDSDIKAAELEANVIASQLEGLLPGDPRRAKLMADLDALRARLRGQSPATSQSPGEASPQTLEDAAKETKASSAISEARSQADSPEDAAQGLISAMDSNVISSSQAVAEAEQIGPETAKIVKEHIASLKRSQDRESIRQHERDMVSQGYYMSGGVGAGMQ